MRHASYYVFLHVMGVVLGLAACQLVTGCGDGDHPKVNPQSGRFQGLNRKTLIITGTPVSVEARMLEVGSTRIIHDGTMSYPLVVVVDLDGRKVVAYTTNYSLYEMAYLETLVGMVRQSITSGKKVHVYGYYEDDGRFKILHLSAGGIGRDFHYRGLGTDYTNGPNP